MSDRSRVGDLPASGSQGEFGSVGYILPGTDWPARCPAGHLRELASPNSNYSHAAQLHEYTCGVCRALGNPRARWTAIDPALQYPADAVPSGLVLVRIPPRRPATPGRIELQLAGACFGAIEVTLCRIEKRAVLEQLLVTEKHRRRGVGRVLVAAALALGAGYDWSMVKPGSSLEARAFWARLGLVCGPATPFYCSHMNDAADRH
jgi:GNAT superfamily N-acetyltransferase